MTHPRRQTGRAKPAPALRVSDSRVPPGQRVPYFLSYRLRQICLGIMDEVLSPAEVLACATTVNAEILGRAGELGVVHPNALADLIVIDGDPLKDLALLGTDGPHLKAVIKGGAFAVDRLGLGALTLAPGPQDCFPEPTPRLKRTSNRRLEDEDA